MSGDPHRYGAPDLGEAVANLTVFVIAPAVQHAARRETACVDVTRAYGREDEPTKNWDGSHTHQRGTITKLTLGIPAPAVGEPLVVLATNADHLERQATGHRRRRVAARGCIVTQTAE